MNREVSWEFSPRIYDGSFFILVLSFFLMVSSVAGFFHFGNLYYIVLGTIGFYYLLQPTVAVKWGIPSIAFFLLACVLSLLSNNPPSFFNAWNRLAIYSMVLLIMSPLVTNKYIGAIRSRIMYYSLCTLSVLSVGSFFAYFLGINLFVRDGSELEIRAGTFSGLMNHSMALGPFAAISAVFLFGSYLSEKKKHLRMVLLFSSVFSMGASLLAASRIAVVAGVVSIFVLVIRFFKGRLTKSLTMILITVTIATASFPLWSSFTDFVVTKNRGNLEEGSIMSSREKKINARVTEFKSSPLVGIGYCTIDPRLDVVQFSNGQIEPGSSWLALASMTGIIGTLVFIFIVIKAFKQAWSISSNKKASILSAILAFFIIHMIAEGYIMAPRSILALFFWLLIGTINASYLEGK